MQNRVKPPILLSRLLGLVLCATLVVAIAMLTVLDGMFPLNKAQVFFLTTRPRDTIEVKLTDLPPTDENLVKYKRAFIREYIKARNEIVPDADKMRAKWNNNAGALVRNWSSDAVFEDFSNTRMWNAIMYDGVGFDWSCPVGFERGAIVARSSDDVYAVKFRYFCANNDGQIAPKDYTIVLKLDTDDTSVTKWADRINNPLGIRVTEYKVESVDGDKSVTTDPLEFDL